MFPLFKCSLFRCSLFRSPLYRVRDSNNNVTKFLDPSHAGERSWGGGGHSMSGGSCGAESKNIVALLQRLNQVRPHLPNQFTTVLHFLPFLVCIHVFLPLDPVQHQLFILLLLLGPTFNDNNVDVIVQDNTTRHEQLLGVRLHLELLCRI